MKAVASIERPWLVLLLLIDQVRVKGHADHAFRHDHEHYHDHDHHDHDHHDHYHRHHYHWNESESGCTGWSVKLDPVDCASWQSLYDSTMGDTWNYYNGTTVRADPCSQTHMVFCSTDGVRILELNLGNRGLKGQIPPGLKFPSLQYLMLAHNNLTGLVPDDLPFPEDCVFPSCCYLNSLARGVFDESAEDGVWNHFDCPLPDGAAEKCNAVCGGDKPARTASLSKYHPRIYSMTPKLEDLDESDDTCQTCEPADPNEFPQCSSSNKYGTNSYCTDKDLVIWSQAIPNHQVFLEEIPKPPGSGLPEGDFPFPARYWNTQSFAFRIPLNPVFSSAITNYSGAGALAVTTTGVPVYPILGPGQTSINLAKLDEEGHDVSKNMKLDQQLDHCNIHAGRGMDAHYHGDPLCMYNDSESGHSPIIGWAADGYPLYGKYDLDHAFPSDLDRCNGHEEPGLGYHYHSSPTFPYTIVCWHGEVDSSNMQPGGQPGQYQWSTDNMRPRNDTEKLLPCCEVSETNADKSSADDVEAFVPTSEGRKIQRNNGSVVDDDHYVGSAQCSGNSTNLLQQDCDAWAALFDSTRGNESWIECSDKRLDPCSW